MSAPVRYLFARLSETSTLRGLVMAAFGLAGVSLDQEEADLLISAAMLLSGLAGAALPDKLGGRGL